MQEKERDIERAIDEAKKAYSSELTNLKIESQSQLEKLRKERSNMERIDRMIINEIEDECKHCCKFLGLTKSWHSEEADNLQDQKINALVSQSLIIPLRDCRY